MMQYVVLLIVQIVNADTLLQVHALWRHGARYPIYLNKNIDQTPYLKDFEKLTPVGMRQHYLLGSWLRSRYIESTPPLLKPTYDDNEIYIKSTDYNRTVQSAQSNLQGMYPFGSGPLVPNVDNQSLLLPPNKGVVVPEYLGDFALPNQIQVVPIHIQETQKDRILHGYSAPCCPKSQQWEQDNLKSKLYLEVDKDPKIVAIKEQFIKELDLSKVYTVDTLTISTMFEYTDTFTSHEWNGIPFPAGLSAELKQKLFDLAPLVFILNNYQDWDQVRTKSSPFLLKVASDMSSIISNKSKFKFYGYSAHDNTILLMLYSLNLTNVQCVKEAYFKQQVSNPNCIYTYPGYASNIILEVWNNTMNVPYIKLLFNGTYQNICSGGGQVCLFSTFQKIVTEQAIDFTQGCGLPSDGQEIRYETPGWAITFLIVLIILLIVGVIGVVFLQKKVKNIRGELVEEQNV